MTAPAQSALLAVGKEGVWGRREATSRTATTERQSRPRPTSFSRRESPRSTGTTGNTSSKAVSQIVTAGGGDLCAAPSPPPRHRLPSDGPPAAWRHTSPAPPAHPRQMGDTAQLRAIPCLASRQGGAATHGGAAPESAEEPQALLSAAARREKGDDSSWGIRAYQGTPSSSDTGSSELRQQQSWRSQPVAIQKERSHLRS